MYIYNVTVNIEELAKDSWLRWMQETHIPNMLATGKFSKALLTKVLVQEEMGGVTYSIQYTTDSKATLQNYYDEDADKLRSQEARLFSGKYVDFRTELEIVSEQ